MGRIVFAAAMSHVLDPEYYQAALSRIPLGRAGTQWASASPPGALTR